MVSRTVARRYAKGLLEAALETDEAGVEKTIRRELDRLVTSVRGHAALRLLLVNPAVHWERKAGIMQELGERLGLHPLLLRFLRHAAAKERLDHLGIIAEVYGEVVDAHRGVVTAEVTAARDLGDEEEEALRSRLEETTGKEVRLRTGTDPELLGGLVTRIGDVLYDGSLRSHLRRIRRRLAAGDLV